jgi:hypothetical protein
MAAIVFRVWRLSPAEGLLLCSLCFEVDCNVESGLPGEWSCEGSGAWETDCDKLDAESFFEYPIESREETRFDFCRVAIFSKHARRSFEGLRLQPGQSYCHLFRSVNDLRLAIVSGGKRRKSG